MAIGGNARARAFFKKHGWTETGSDKIIAKVYNFFVVPSLFVVVIVG